MDSLASRCFVIGPIGDAGSAIRRKADWVLHGLIKPVLEDPAFGYDVKRADQDPNPGSISDAMINDIFDAELVVADLTGFNPNAFYELGIRHAFQKPAIHIIAERGVKPPFDNQDQRTIEIDFEDFHHVEEARRSLKAAVSYVRGAEFKVSNPVTRARGIAELKASGDPKDLLLAQLQGNLDTMSRRLNRLERSPKVGIVTDKSHIGAPASMRERFGSYYDYIREATDKGIQTPFHRQVVDAAISFDDRDSFAEWYLRDADIRVKAWLSNLSSLSDEGLELIITGPIMDSLSKSQASRIVDEKRRRSGIGTETDEWK